jgi:adenine-specific DNA-methyltransferase
MPTLNWIAKEAVVNHHQQVPFHLLKDVPELACGNPGDGNLIVQGDNLVALKALLPYYAGQVKASTLIRLTTRARKAGLITTPLA